MKFLSKKSLAFLIVGIAVTALGVTALYQPKASVAAGSPNVTGWAFSDMPDKSDEEATGPNKCPVPPNPGWQNCGRGVGAISLNSTNAGAGTGIDYGVNLDPTGKFTGKGWSEWGGWVDFAPTSGFPEAPAHGAQVDQTCLSGATACAISGWIRFTGASADPESGGWDGWVKMSGTAANGRDYGVGLLAPTTTGRNFDAGYAWGGDVVGWVKFNAQIISCDANNPNWDPITQTCDLQIRGCMDSAALNYDATATIDTVPSSCIYPPCTPQSPDWDPATQTCTTQCDPSDDDWNPVFNDCRACHPGVPNYNSTTGLCNSNPTCNANDDDWNPVFNDCRACHPGVTGYNATTGYCSNPTLGCTDDRSPNYDPDATLDDGSCTLCDSSSPSWNPIKQICSSCNKTVPGYNPLTGTCPKRPIYDECGSGSCLQGQSTPINPNGPVVQ